MGTREMIPIRADVFDALKASAERYGGIGGGYMREYWKDDNAPHCLLGHAFDIADRDDEPIPDINDRLLDATDGSPADLNDAVVERINIRNDAPNFYDRVTWEEYIAEMNWVRSESSSSVASGGERR